MAKNILIVDSGSTKTDWCYINKDGKIKQFKTEGINPNLMDASSIALLIEQCFQKHLKNHAIKAIHYYGAGIGTNQNKKIVTIRNLNTKNFFITMIYYIIINFIDKNISIFFSM